MRAAQLQAGILRAQRAQLVQAAPKRRPRLLHPAWCGAHAVRRLLEPAEDVPERALGRLDACQGVGERHPGVPALFWAEEQLTK